MATGNFYTNGNSAHIYAIGMNYIDEETGETHYPESFEIEEELDYVTECIKNTSLYTWNENTQAYDGQTIISVELTDEYYNEELRVYTHVNIHSGYYEGASIDWDDVMFEVAGDDGDDVSYIHLDYSEMNEGLKAIALPRIQQRLEAMKEKLENELNNALKKSTKAYGVTARFSNGETIYHEVA